MYRYGRGRGNKRQGLRVLYQCGFKCLSEYAGKWIAVMDGKVVTSGDRADEVYDEAKRKYPDKEVMLAKVPTADTLILLDV